MAISNTGLSSAFYSGSGSRIRRALEAFSQRSVASLPNDANATLTRSSAPYQVTAAAITANRTITLPTEAQNGDNFFVTRTAASTGAFTLTVAGKALSAGQWAHVAYNGTAWYVVAAGSL